MPRAKAKPVTTVTQLAEAAFRQYVPALRRYVFGRLGRHADVADVTQTIFEEFLKVPQPERVRDPEAYLFGIAYRAVSDAYRKANRDFVTYDSELADMAGETEPSAEDVADRVSLHQDLTEALLKLPENYLAAIMLCEGEGLSHKEAARITGFSPNTIANYVVLGRAKLKTILAEYWGKDTSK
jgi:RNA polymerase sigma factor (sigma-70 family)